MRIDPMHLAFSLGCAVFDIVGKTVEVPKIISCTIGPYPQSFLDPMPSVVVTFEDGTTKKLFWFYPDELSFAAEEFIGLSEKEARHLKYAKDLAYLQS